MKKRLISAILVLAMLCSMCGFVYAVEEDIMPINDEVTIISAPDYTAQADTLFALGLFQGTGAEGYALDRAATRIEAAAMVVRLLGVEAVAAAEKNEHPFTDVPSWAKDAVGYLFAHGITNGTSYTTFGSTDLSSAGQYATFILRALGYTDSEDGFTWKTAMNKLVELAIILQAQSDELGNPSPTLRGHMVSLSYNALFANVKNTETTLLEKLYVEDGAVSEAQLSQAALDMRICNISNKFGVLAPVPTTEKLDSVDLYAMANDAVFTYELFTFAGGEYGSGSGFFISSDGWAITNFHVAAVGWSAKIKTADGTYYDVEGIYGYDYYNDLALVKIAGDNFPYLQLGDPTKLTVGQKIYTIGSPYGLENTFSDGMVSSVSREVEGQTFIQITAPITDGSSGGVLLNEYGQAVGVTSAGYDSGNLNLAVPVTMIKSIWRFDEIRSYRFIEACLMYGGLYPTCVDDVQTRPANVVSDSNRLENGELTEGYVLNADDVALYTFTLAQNSDVNLMLFTDSAHGDKIRLDIMANGTDKVLLSAINYGNDNFVVCTGRLPAGSYTVKVYGDNGVAWDNVRYELQYAILGSVSDDYYSSYFFEFENNNTVAQSNFLPVYASLFGSFQSRSDVDVFKITLDKPTNIYLDVSLVADELYGKAMMDARLTNAAGATVGVFEYYDYYGAFDGMELETDLLPAGDYYITIKSTAQDLQWIDEFYELWYIEFDPSLYY